MVTKYGMSDKMGQVSVEYDDDGRSMSSETRSVIEEEVKVLLQVRKPSDTATRSSIIFWVGLAWFG